MFSNWLEQKDNELFSFINEAKKKHKGKSKDITGDGKADFADVMKARLLAGGKSEEEAQEMAEKHHKGKK
jgi:hypothetical protein